MATVYLVDVTYLAPHLSPHHGAPPLSWWCAGEVAQWASSLALRDAWAATAAHHDEPLSHTEHVSSCSADRRGYTRFDEEGNEEGTVATAAPATAHTPSASPALYRWSPFPSPVTIRNKYFGVTLHLVVGSAPPRCGSAHAITTSLTQTPLCGSVVGGGLVACYGGVLVADVRQDPAELPWHVFARGGGCVFRLVMVFLTSQWEAGEDDASAEATHAHRHGTTPSQKERWQFFAVENGYECVFHTSLALFDTQETAVGSLEVVFAASGRRGLLEAPLHGSNRLYQVLCNALWPVEVRDGPVKDSNSNSATAAVVAVKAEAHARQNAFVVVGNNAAALAHLFGDTDANNAARTRRQLRFFSKFVPAGVEADCGGASSAERPASAACNRQAEISASTALVLVNKYYAAVTHPCLVQTAYFCHEMQDVLQHYWERHFSPTGTSSALCRDAPAIVLWPPSPFSVFSTSAVTAADHESEHDTRDVRSDYPPLETILDTLKRNGCGEIVVVTPSALVPDVSTSVQRRRRRGPDASLLLTPYELCVCAERNVEVVNLQADHAHHVSVDDGAPPVPVLKDEDDVCATRAIDRLGEILHCVQWDRTSLLPSLSADMPASAQALRVRSVNSCLVAAYGTDAFQEEAWMSAVAAALRLSERPTARERQDADALAAAAPTIAAAVMAPSTAGETSHSLLSEYPVRVSNAYFLAEVQLCCEGGLRNHYCGTTPRSLPADWLEAHDGYIIITGLDQLQEAATAVAAVSKTAADASLGGALAALMRRAAEWLASQPLPGDTACADSPLVLLYVADVRATDQSGAALVDACLRTIAMVSAGGEEEVDVLSVPLEIILVGEEEAPSSTTAKKSNSWEDATEGLQRLREAVEQQLWPHRQACGDRAEAHSNSGAGAVIDDSSTAAAPAVAVEEQAVKAAVAVPTSPPPAPPTTPWVAPVIGCALPPHFLIDPETLRSVPLCALTHTSPAETAGVVATQLDGASAETTPLEGVQRGGSTSTPQSEAEAITRSSLCEGELMRWMEKMKAHGHRLGAAQRKEQAATLALALEACL